VLKIDSNLVFVRFVFTLVPLFCFCWFYLPFHKGTARNPARSYAETLKIMTMTDYSPRLNSYHVATAHVTGQGTA